MLDISELPNATEDESSISSINIADLNAIPAAKIAQHEETTKTKEMPEEKVGNIRFGLIKTYIIPFYMQKEKLQT